MKRWQTDFLDGLRRGVPADLCAKQYAGLPLSAVHDKREEDEEFAAAWDAIVPCDEESDGIAGLRVLSPGTLERVLRAQVSDVEAAAYFGMKEEVFLARIAENGRLAKVYDTARDGGKAEIRMAQHDAAIEGDKTMLTWLGKQYLGQTDKIDHKVDKPVEGQPVSITQIVLQSLPQEQLEALYAKAMNNGYQIIDVKPDSVHVEEKTE